MLTNISHLRSLLLQNLRKRPAERDIDGYRVIKVTLIKKHGIPILKWLYVISEHKNYDLWDPKVWRLCHNENNSVYN